MAAYNGANVEDMDSEPVKPQASNQSLFPPDHTYMGDRQPPDSSKCSSAPDSSAQQVRGYRDDGVGGRAGLSGEQVPTRRKRERQAEEGENEAVEKKAAEEGLSWWTCLMLGVGQERTKPQVVKKVHHNYYTCKRGN